MLRPTFFAVFVALVSLPVLAADKTVTLSVPGMYCELCPATVKKSISRVHGVSRVEASFKTKAAIVTYDDSQTDVDALTRATKNAGYPSTPKP
jgi:periplasmic mercuric ion binding protein